MCVRERERETEREREREEKEKETTGIDRGVTRILGGLYWPWNVGARPGFGRAIGRGARRGVRRGDGLTGVSGFHLSLERACPLHRGNPYSCEADGNWNCLSLESGLP